MQSTSSLVGAWQPRAGEAVISGPAATATRRLWLILLLAVGCSGADGPVTITEAGYSVQMPGPVTVQEQKQELGFVRLHRARVGPRVFVAGFSDNLGVELTSEEMLDALQSGYVGSDRILHQEPIQLAGHPGRGLQIGGRGLTLFLRLYCIGRRSYQISVLSKDGDVSAVETERFFASFRLTDMP